jgi:peptide chain release factor 1
MSVIPKETLGRLIERYETIQAELNQGASQATYAKLTKEFSDLTPLITAVRELESAENEQQDLQALIRDASQDKEMIEMAREELSQLGPRIEDMEQKLRILLLPKDAADERSAILEVRAGTGGDEAALFAADLFRMYQRYADLKGWTTEIISISESDLGGYREIIASITGKGVFARLKYESGVHRVQRIPLTEANGRIHTSTVTVAVLPEAEEVDVEIDPQDLDITVQRASGPGGQGVNTTDSAVRIVHKPSGLTVYCADDRSQIKNKASAMSVLRSRLLKMKEDEEKAKYAAQRRNQIGTGGRSERIRTYNFPQNRMTDHRIGLTLYSLPQIMEGNIDPIIQALQRADFEEKFAALTGRPIPVHNRSGGDDE